jgi:hypothetical protein
MADFDKLAAALYDGPVKASDIKTMAGTDPSVSRDELSKTLLDSMIRMGLVVDGHLVNTIEPKSQ